MQDDEKNDKEHEIGQSKSKAVREGDYLFVQTENAWKKKTDG